MKHKILAMPVLRSAIIVVCLALAGSDVQGQEDQDEFGELTRQFFADVGVTEAELMQFGVNIAGVLEPYQPFDETNASFFGKTTRENYTEIAGEYYDNFVLPLFNDIKTEAVNFFSEEQYSKMVQRIYQIAENFPNALQGNGVDLGGLFQLILLPDVVSLTKEQLSDIAALQREVMTEIVGNEIIVRKDHAELFIEQDTLFREMQIAETEEEKAAIRTKFSEVTGKTSVLLQEPIQKVFAKMKTKLDTLLTAEQKVKLTQMKEDIPDYLKKALADMKPDDDEVPAEWRPGINSWVPGMGAPGINPNREVPRVRETQSGRSFPGGE